MAEKWYYCLKHQRAESGKQCWFRDRMGPYPDRATAERALEIVHARNTREDSRDREWRDGDK
ncbi:SPOR domain-containing protein [Nocardia sp. R16R-3T]